MEILRELETTPRDAYCGAIGWIAPGGTMRFNVAIRTISLFPDGEAVYNVGGGVVFDSTAEEEYAECLLKARFATGTAAGFELIETLRWEPDSGFVRLDRHLARLASSARQLGFLFSRPALDDRLKTVTSAGPLQSAPDAFERAGSSPLPLNRSSLFPRERSGRCASPRHASMPPIRLSATRPRGGRSTRPRAPNFGRRKPTKSFCSTSAASLRRHDHQHLCRR